MAKWWIGWSMFLTSNMGKLEMLRPRSAGTQVRRWRTNTEFLGRVLRSLDQKPEYL